MATGYDSSVIANKRIPEGQLPDYYKKLILHAKSEPGRSELKKEMDCVVEQKDTNAFVELAKRYPNRLGKLFIIDIGAASPTRIEREVQRLGMDHKIDYVFVDFINVMDPDFHNRDKVKELASISRDLKKVARRTKTILFSAAQLDTTSIEGKSQDEKISPDRVKYARAIAENSDWMIAFHRTEEDIRLKQIRLQMAKHRSSADCAALLEFDFSTLHGIDLGKPDPAKASDMGSADNSKYKGSGSYKPGGWSHEQEFN
jgi:replicative DNA helicase